MVSRRARRAFWDIVTVLAVIGVAYGAWEIISIKGWGLGFPMALLSAILGLIAVELLYPLWFGHR